ncbi:MAG: hypothetical protein DRP08_06100 [Candidatus Aenigmatarchaeota archaeon]|nr:MAG: hypothetical protein DRP08_06100 [Candidatus Aenigmarchaeota archaeon]
MNTQELCKAIIDENLKLLKHVQTQEVEVLIRGLDQAENIFCAAQGRSGYILRCFCMRLAHLGCQAYFAGETVTPRIKSGDILVVLSGSGRTAYTVELIKMAKQTRAATYGVIGTKDSPMGRNLDHAVFLPVPSRNNKSPSENPSIQSLDSLFEQAAFILLESILLEFFQKQGSNQAVLLERHTNLE